MDGRRLTASECLSSLISRRCAGDRGYVAVPHSRPYDGPTPRTYLRIGMTSIGRRVAVLCAAIGNRTWRQSRLSALGLGAATLAALIGFGGILGWAFDVPELRQPLPGATAIAFNTAVALV